MRRLTDTQLLLVMEACMDSVERCKKRIEETKARGDDTASRWAGRMLEQYSASLDRLIEELNSRSIEADQLPDGNTPAHRLQAPEKTPGTRVNS